MDDMTITCEQLRDALRQLYHDRVPGPTPLADLAVVRQSLQRAGFRLTPAARGYEIGRLLTEIVETELAAWRRRFGIAPGTEPVDHRAQIRADFTAGHRELESWSTIYYLCVRTDLDYGLQTFTDVLRDRHRRTVQRRLHRGVEAMTARLRALERAAVLAEHRADDGAERTAQSGAPPADARPAILGTRGRLGALPVRLEAARMAARNGGSGKARA